jgi:ABC-type multidrug transport system ATPase subunit
MALGKLRQLNEHILILSMQYLYSTYKKADDLLFLAEEEMVLQDMIDKLIEIGRCYGMEMNVEQKKINENFKQTIASKTYEKKKLGNVESFKYLGSIYLMLVILYTLC